MFHPTGAAQGWVAIGFGDDRAMGNDAVLMATASTLTSRWNDGMPKQSLKTEDIGIKNARVQGSDNSIESGCVLGHFSGYFWGLFWGYFLPHDHEIRNRSKLVKIAQKAAQNLS